MERIEGFEHGESLIGKAKKMHHESVKPFGKLEHGKIDKLSPLDD